MKYVFTIAAANYLNRALAALGSHRAHNKGVRYRLVVCEKPETVATLTVPTWVERCDPWGIGVPDPRRLFFQYDILEAATAIKPFVFRELFSAGAKEVTYIDPDVWVYRTLYSVADYGSDAVVTPHLTDDRPDGLFPDMRQNLLCGQFNFGYLSLANTANARDFLAWWADTLLTKCVKDPSNSVFVDQSWGAAIVSFMDKVRVERRHGSHAAYWNLRPGDVERLGPGEYTVRGQPLTMFHFSGLDPLDATRLSRHSERFNPLIPGDPISALVAEYCRDAMARHADSPVKDIPYSFAKYEDGQWITLSDRRAILSSRRAPGALFEARPPAAEPQTGFREAYVRRTWQYLGRKGPRGTPVRIALYGAGQHLDWLAHAVAGCDPAPVVEAILDDGPRKDLHHFNIGRSTRPEEHNLPRFDTVLVNTDMPALAERLRHKAHTIFGTKVAVVSLYEGCPAGQYV